jgi:hypothetical protein
VFPMRYELNLYIKLFRKYVLEGLNKKIIIHNQILLKIFHFHALELQNNLWSLSAESAVTSVILT